MDRDSIIATMEKQAGYWVRTAAAEKAALAQLAK
jgi:hypothetical protein